VEFIIKGIEFGEMTDEEIEVILGLRREMGVNGVKMLNEENRVCEYGSIEEMLKGFYEVRLKYYAKRKEYMMSYLSQEKYRLEKKIKFLTYIHNNGPGNIAEIIKKRI